jgi:hypothetical protein
MLGYKREEVEEMATVMNYTLHHHLTKTKFIEEDRVVLERIEELLQGLLAEDRV